MSEIVDPFIDARFSLFDDDDKAFLKSFFKQHPQVGENFSTFLALPEALRPRFADVATQDIKRAGWVKRGIKNAETVWSHATSLAAMADDIAADLTAKMGITGEGARYIRTHLSQMARVHDIHEAITTDFTPSDPVSAADQQRIELLASRVIFAASQFARGRALSEEYITQKSDPSHLLHDLDKIHPVIMAAYFEQKQPEKAGMCEEFRASAAKKLKTNVGKAFLENFMAEKEEALDKFFNRKRSGPQTAI